MRNHLFFVPLAALLVAALACGGGSSTPTPSGPKVLLKDDFSDSSSGWGTGTDSESSLEYQDGKYVVKIEETDLLVWGTQEADDISNVHIAVEAQNVGGAVDPTFGIICNYQDDQNFYYMGIGVDGYYAIAKYESDELTIMTGEDNQWVQSERIELDADSYSVEADCGNGRLSLYVDGVRIDSVEDQAFSQGQIGLFARSFESTGVEVHFDDLVVTELE